MIMAMRHRQLPPTLHIDQPSPHVDWTAGNIELTTQSTPWPVTDHPHRAAISSFGISGTNAHIIIEQPPAREDVSAEPDLPDWCTDRTIWPISGQTTGALRDQACRLIEFRTAQPELSATDVAFSLATTRTAFPCRAVVIGGKRGGLDAGLKAVANGQSDACEARLGDGPVYIELPGPDSPWRRVAAELLADSPRFAEFYQECVEAIAVHGDVNDERCSRFVMTVALARLWQLLGVRMDVFTGDPGQRIAAAHLAGDISLADAAAIVAAGATRPDDANEPDYFRPVTDGPSVLQLVTTGSAMDALVAAYCAGATVDWSRVRPVRHVARVDLPTYAFQCERYWLDPSDSHRSPFPAHRLAWQPVSNAAAGEPHGTWLVLAPIDSTEDTFVIESIDALVSHGVDVVRYDVDLTAESDDPDRLANTLGSIVADITPQGVLSLLDTDDVHAPNEPLVTRGVSATLTLAHVIREFTPAIPLWCATQ